MTESTLFYRATCSAADLANLNENERSRPTVYLQTSRVGDAYEGAARTTQALTDNGYQPDGPALLAPAVVVPKASGNYELQSPIYIQRWILKERVEPQGS